MKHRITLLLTLVALLGAAHPPLPNVSVAYAASLLQTMEGPIATALLTREHLHFQGEPAGSRELANLIRAGVQTPDVFISAAPSILGDLKGPAHGNYIEHDLIFGQANLVLAYSPSSRFAPALAAVALGKASLGSVLETPGLRIARTDPRLDPKGGKTIAAIRALGASMHDPGYEARLLGPALNPRQIFPEEDLIVRVESGQADVGFFYSTETKVKGLKTIVLPDGIGARPGIAVRYTLAVLRQAPHPRAAATFVRFILAGPGRAILQRAGVNYTIAP
ncbi:MAG: substrate-binding domain-containing protein [Vulcanimicrobiaceae bacterium]